jgi:hypothetical protein
MYYDNIYLKILKSQINIKNISNTFKKSSKLLITKNNLNSFEYKIPTLHNNIYPIVTNNCKSNKEFPLINHIELFKYGKLKNYNNFIYLKNLNIKKLNTKYLTKKITNKINFNNNVFINIYNKYLKKYLECYCILRNKTKTINNNYNIYKS